MIVLCFDSHGDPIYRFRDTEVCGKPLLRGDAICRGLVTRHFIDNREVHICNQCDNRLTVAYGVSEDGTRRVPYHSDLGPPRPFFEGYTFKLGANGSFKLLPKVTLPSDHRQAPWPAPIPSPTPSRPSMSVATTSVPQTSTPRSTSHLKSVT